MMQYWCIVLKGRKSMEEFQQLKLAGHFSAVSSICEETGGL